MLSNVPLTKELKSNSGGTEGGESRRSVPPPGSRVIPPPPGKPPRVEGSAVIEVFRTRLARLRIAKARWPVTWTVTSGPR